MILPLKFKFFAPHNNPYCIKLGVELQNKLLLRKNTQKKRKWITVKCSLLSVIPGSVWHGGKRMFLIR